MNKQIKWLALVLAVVMLLGVMAGCGKTETEEAVTEETTVAQTATEETAAEEEGVTDTLVVGYSNFSEKFSPFFAESAYDQDVYVMVSEAILGNDRDGSIIYNGIEGETHTYNGTEYTYTGIADCEVVENEDGSIDYNFTMRDDIVFSDGVPMTADDAIFSMYVLSDPTYDGSSTLYALPITGMEEYRAGMSPLYRLILEDYLFDSTDNAAFYTEEQYTTYTEAFQSAMEIFAQEIVDYCVEALGTDDYAGSEVACGMVNWGFGAMTDGIFVDALGTEYSMADENSMPTIDDYILNLVLAYDYNISSMSATESAGSDAAAAIDEALGDDATLYTAGVATGDSVDYIEGITKTGDYSYSVHMDKVDAAAIYQLGIVVAPLHYYGDADAYDYDAHNFGFTKGDLSSVRAKTTEPLGAGPYKFVSYENGVVSFEANEYYWKGEPKVKYLLFQECADADKLTGVASGTFDISDPSISVSAATSIKEYNSNGELTGDVLTTDLVDNLGYGYIGICADNVLVGTDKASEESKNLRKGLATLFAIYRESSVNSYYAELAEVIQYPISNTSWAAPRPSDEGYEQAYSTDVDGNPIYTDDMTDEERYAAALEAAIGFFKAAGYTWDEEAGVFTAAPEGAKMVYELQIPADGVGDHPVFAVATNVSTALKTIGLDLQVNDLSNSSALWDNLDAGAVDMWCAAWGATIDPDMYQVYHSSNTTNSNHYRIFDEQLDELIVAARESADQTYRKATYKQALDIILDWGVEVPAYQRKNCILLSTERVNIDTVTPDITTFWNWYSDIQNIEMN